MPPKRRRKAAPLHKELRELERDSVRPDIASNRKRRKCRPAVATLPVDELVKHAEELVERAEHAAALQFYERALSLRPADAQLLDSFGEVAMEVGEVEKAVTAFQRSIELEPAGSPQKYMYLGQLQEGMDAARTFEHGIELMERALRSRDEASEEAMAAGTPAPADKTGVTRRQQCRQLSSAHCSLAELFMTDLCYEPDAEERCERALLRAVAVDGRNPEAHCTMANFRLCQQRPELAQESLRQANEILQDARTALGRAPAADGDGDGAAGTDPLDAFLGVGSGELWLSAGRMALEAGALEEAAAFFRGTLQHDELNFEAWIRLVHTCMELDAASDARENAAKALELAQAREGLLRAVVASEQGLAQWAEQMPGVRIPPSVADAKEELEEIQGAIEQLRSLCDEVGGGGIGGGGDAGMDDDDDDEDEDGQ